MMHALVQIPALIAKNQAVNIIYNAQIDQSKTNTLC